MKDLKTIQVAQQLTKNLMWLERSNPLLTIPELLKYGTSISERIMNQYLQVKELWQNELQNMKTLEMILRYLQHCELDTICSTQKAPVAPPRWREAPTRGRRLTTLGRGYDSDLSLPMARGRAENLGGGSRRSLHTA